MIIEEVELENFLSHRLSRVRLGPGVIAIVGPNGAGKTSIVDAITYTLFDTHSRPGARKEALIRLGAPVARITVRFRVGGKVYEATRIIQRGSSPTQAKLYVFENGAKRLLAHGVRNVGLEISRILGFDPKLASLLLVTKQGEIESILTDKDKRLEVIANLLKLKAMEKAEERVRELLRELARKLGNYEGRLKEIRNQISRLQADEKRVERLRIEREKVRELLARKRSMLDEARRALEQLENSVMKAERAEAELPRLREKLMLLRERLSRLEREYAEALRAKEDLAEYEAKLAVAEKVKEALTLSEKLKAMEESIEDLKAKIDELQQTNERLAQLKPLVEEYNRLKQRILLLQKTRDEYMMLERLYQQVATELEDVRREVESLESQLLSHVRSQLPLEPPADTQKLPEFLEALIRDAEERIEQLERKRSEIIEKKGRLREALNYTESVLLKLTSASGKCPLCSQPLTNDHRMKLIARFRNERRKYELEMKSLANLEEKLASEIENLRRFKEHIRKVLQYVHDKLRVIASHTDKLRSLEEKAKELSRRKLELIGKYKEYEEALKRLEELDKAYLEYERLEERVKALRKDLERLEELTKTFNLTREKLSKILGELGINQDQLEMLRSEVNEIYTIVGELRSKASKLDELTLELEKTRREYENTLSTVKRLEKELAALRGVREKYERMRESVESLANEVHELEVKLSKIEGELAALEQELEQLKLLKAEYDALREKYDRMSRAVKFLEQMKILLGPNGIPRLVRQLARSVLEYHLREILSAFNVDFNDVRLTDDYDVILVTRHGEKSVGMLSGGERIAVAIAYRLALARMVKGRIETLIMDEPTVHLDAERRRELVNIIRRSLESTGLTQLIVVTHDREVEDAADTIIEVSRGADGFSTIKIH